MPPRSVRGRGLSIYISNGILQVIPGAIQKSGIGKEAACICVRQSRRSINRFSNHERYILTIDSHSMKVAQDRTLIHFLPLIEPRGLRSNYH